MAHALVAAAGLAANYSIATMPQDKPFIEPYQYLYGGAFSGPTQPLSPDPLVSYQWGPGVNQTALQIYDMFPVSASLYNGSSNDAFIGLPSVVNRTSSLIVVGAGSFMVDFGVENAAWLEFDSPDLQAQDLPLITLSVSEWTQPYDGKVLTPKAYNGTYRLETNSELYEGVRFGFFMISAAPSQPFHVTGIRAVSQAKPVNYTGSFSASGDDLLTRIWYTAAYTVRLNLEESYIGAILMYRGDRFSWTGDAHVAQSASMTAFGNFDFVLVNLQRTDSDCNSIESYCLYWALSALEYYRRSGDTSSLTGWLANIDAKLEHAHDLWANPTGLAFFGWDDRLGSGFANASTVESQFDYRFLAMRAWREYAAVQTTLGNTTAAAHWTGYFNDAATAVRSTWGPQWYAQLGVHAASDAINAGFMQPAEVAAVAGAQLNNAVTLCSLSNFNQYWILQALGNAGVMDKAVASVHRCWGDEVGLGATSFWEISHPEWNTVLRQLQPMPYGNNGVTSLCHPWSAGPVSWLSTNMVGVRPATPGYERVVVAPHLHAGISHDTEGKPLLRGEVPTPQGVVSVELGSDAVTVSLPAGVTGQLQLSAVVLKRLGWLTAQPEQQGTGGFKVSINGQPASMTWDEPTLTMSSSSSSPAAAFPVVEDGSEAHEAWRAHMVQDEAGTYRWKVAVLDMATGATVLRPLSSHPAVPSSLSAPSPFPPVSWPGRLVAVDTSTQGSWLGRYGSAGYALAGFNTDGTDLVSLPPFIASVACFQCTTDQWTQPDPAADPRALQNPANASAARGVGCWYSSMTTAVDIWMPAAQEGQVWYQVAVYVVDFDRDTPSHDSLGPRRETIAPMDRLTLNPAAPLQYADELETGAGTWYVFQYNGSMRIRASQTEGDNAVISAVAFDTV